MDSVEIDFGRFLRKLRDGKGLTQEQLASQCGVSVTHISLIENGHRSPGERLCFSLAACLGYSPVKLVRRARFAKDPELESGLELEDQNRELNTASSNKLPKESVAIGKIDKLHTLLRDLEECLSEEKCNELISFISRVCEFYINSNDVPKDKDKVYEEDLEKPPAFEVIMSEEMKAPRSKLWDTKRKRTLKSQR